MYYLLLNEWLSISPNLTGLRRVLSYRVLPKRRRRDEVVGSGLPWHYRGCYTYRGDFGQLAYQR